MTLTTRLTVFFLAALGGVLVGFSAGLCVLARWYLYADRADQLSVALHTLVAAAEIDPAGVEWDTRERPVSLGLGRKRDQFRWMVGNDAGAVIDGSPGAAADQVLGQAPPLRDVGMQPRMSVEHAGETWWMMQRRLVAGPSTHPANHTDVDDDADELPKYPALVLTVVLSIEPVRDALRLMAFTSTGLSAALWLAVAFMSRRICRGALRPMIEMADKARSIEAAELHERLPNPCTRDEAEQLCRAFNDLLARLEESFARQRRFTGDASHQLRTPLAAMLGQLEVALRRPRSPDEYVRVLDSVRGQAGRLRHIVDMLLFLARADSDAKLPDLEAVDLSAWLPDHLQTWAGHSRAADLHVECPDGEPIVVDAEPHLLGQMLDNLLDNAFKYSEPVTPVTLRVAPGAGANMVAITVEDAGPGIPAADLPHIFEPFYCSPDARRRGRAGCGLGLSVAHRIATAFGGSLHAQSTPAEGSRFTILLRRHDHDHEQDRLAPLALQTNTRP